MKVRPAAWVVLASLSVLPALEAAEPYEAFVHGLQRRGYYDYALFYLEQIEARPDLPVEVKQAIPYEKAITLVQSAKELRTPEAQSETLDKALGFLEQFVKESPQHPAAGNANTERANILLGKARVEILQSRSPANQGAKAEYQQRARSYIEQARAVYQEARDQHEAAWKRFGTYINEAEEPEKFKARGEAEVNFIRAQLDLALCTYEEAQTYDRTAPDYKRLLTAAAEQFEQIHQRYRSQVGGLYARLWQGKCFEEQDDIQKALGIYNELLDHPGGGETMRRLQDQTLQFRLICLNHEQRKDYQLVVQEAEEWLKSAGAQARTKIGLGIRWELTRALEALGAPRELQETERNRILRRALAEARDINRYAGEYRDVSRTMIQRLEVLLGRDATEPDKFDAAYGIGNQLVQGIKKLSDQLALARKEKKPKEELQKLQRDLDAQLSEAEHMLDLALKLVTPQDDAKSINRCRFLLAYVKYLMRRSYEAAILGEYVARTVSDEETTQGLEAAYLAMASYVRAYNDAPDDLKQVDMQFMIRTCDLIATRWPESNRANDARMTLGRSYSQLDQPVEAAKWFGEVPPTAPEYAEAQLAAGQAYWTAFLNAAGVAEAERPAADQLQQWQAAALEHLQAGLDKMVATLPTEGAVAPPELIAAKMSMAQIMIMSGQDQQAIDLLTNDPHSVLEAIAVADESARPAEGIQGRTFAAETYKLLLRAYVGAGRLDEARSTMAALEKVAGGSEGGDVTQLYVDLGREIERELKQLRATGQSSRFNQVQSSFETFLNDMYQRQEGHTFNSLQWIGETYFGLAEANEEEDRSRADGYYEKAAAAFADIVTRAGERADFAVPEPLLAVKVRLATCRRKQQRFQEAEDIIAVVLGQKQEDLRAQVEAAYILQEWGDSGVDGAEHYKHAIEGKDLDGIEKLVWGWGHLGRLLQNSVRSTGRADLREKFLEARYNVAYCRHKLAQTMSSVSKQRHELDKAEMELVATVGITKEMPDETWEKFDELYQTVLADYNDPLEKPVRPLERPREVPPPPPAAAEPAVATVPEAEPAPVTAPPPQVSLFQIVGLVVCLIVGVGILAYAYLATGRRKRVAVAAARSPAGARQQRSKRPAANNPTRSGSPSAKRKQPPGG